MIAGLVCFLIWAVIQVNRTDYHLTVQPRSSKPNVYHYPNPTKVESYTSIQVPAKKPDLPFREQLEKIQEVELHMNTHDKSKKAYRNVEKPATWFIGTWGINDPSIAEQLIINELNKYKVRWYREVSFSNLILPSGGYPRFDFYLPVHTVAIEYQGEGYHSSTERKASDKIKAKYCKDNDIILHVYDIQHYRTMPATIANLMKSLQVRLK